MCIAISKPEGCPNLTDQLLAEEPISKDPISLVYGDMGIFPPTQAEESLCQQLRDCRSLLDGAIQKACVGSSQ